MQRNLMFTVRLPILGTAVLGFFVVALWAFPGAWYTRSDRSLHPVWLNERTNLAGWRFREIPVADSAEKLLVADRTVSGEFDQAGTQTSVQVFSAKRYTAKPYDIGLFVHTPDRCWTQAGWKFEPVVPDSVELDVHGVKILFERRVFVAGGHRELVYFGGLVGGQPLPYRLDHNLSVGMKFAVDEAAKKSGAAGAGTRAVDKRFWERIWEAFKARRQILGPKQFVRISTEVVGGDLASADARLRSFLELWLEPTDYDAELRSWTERKT